MSQYQGDTALIQITVRAADIAIDKLIIYLILLKLGNTIPSESYVAAQTSAEGPSIFVSIQTIPHPSADLDSHLTHRLYVREPET